LVVAIEMGYGHLRPADALASALGTEVLHADRAPLASVDEQRLWGTARGLYERWCRATARPLVGVPLRAALDRLTAIPPLHPRRDLSPPTAATRVLDGLGRLGLGAGLAARMQRTGEALLTTFFAPAVLADARGLGRVFCVVTDADINRVWAPRVPAASRVRYLAPSVRAARRLRDYGVPAANIEVTGYPLPDELVGGRARTTLRRNLARRLARLDLRGRFRAAFGAEAEAQLGAAIEGDGRPPRLTFAVGGAGTQAELAERFLPGFVAPLRAGRLRLTLVAGVRSDVAARLRRAVDASGVPDVEILHEPDFGAYFRRFNALLADSDVLWTKPSEMTFFAALGLPLVIAPPIGVHEQYNRRWAMEAGAGVAQEVPEAAADWIEERLRDGSLAGAAWSGFRRLPADGLYRVLDALNR
jgi:UDP-N-acetylglucosamine:LPS N-acetylglucosamine transferase